MLLVVAIILSVSSILWNGIKLGSDFTGGTVLVFQFERPLTEDEMREAVLTLERRLNWSGLLDITVRPWGNQHVIVELGELDPETVEKIKRYVLKQGHFEGVVDGNVVLYGSDLTLKGEYRIVPDVFGGYRWDLPFVLTPEGAERFYKGVFHKCEGGCKDVYFFIDRPVGYAVLVEEINTELNELFLNAGVVPVTDVNQLEELNIRGVLLPEGMEYNGVLPVRYYTDLLEALGFRTKVKLTPEITGEGVERFEDMKISTTLVITGVAPTKEEAEERIEELRIILNSGSLPAAIKLVSEKTVPPEYGQRLLVTLAMALLLSMLAVALFIALRYRDIRISLPIAVTIISETLIVLGIASAIGWKLDLGSLIGLVAATGSGVDDQIIITEEVTRGERKKERITLLRRIKEAFFVVYASAAALGSVMVPILVVNIPQLTGFALTTLMGILVGILITRPAYAEMLRLLLSK